MAASKFITPPPLSERLAKEEEFYNKDFFMSYSGLNKLLYSPALFYNHYVLKQRDDTEDQNMIEGRLIHCLLLNKEDFDEQFILSPQDNPTDSQKTVIYRLYDHYKVLKNDEALDGRETLEDFKDAIEDILTDMNLYQSMKQETRLNKMISEITENFWSYLKRAEGKTIIDQDTYDFASAVVDRITSNAPVMEVMGYFGDEFNGIEKTNEIELLLRKDEIEDDFFGHALQFGLRGFADNIVFDHSNKVIRVNDLKKTGKVLSTFADSVEYYRYWLQAAMYYKMVTYLYLSNPELKDYKIEFRFIVVDSQMQVAPVKVSDETMEKWIEDTAQCLKEASLHFELRNFELPYEFLTNKELTL